MTAIAVLLLSMFFLGGLYQGPAADAGKIKNNPEDTMVDSLLKSDSTRLRDVKLTAIFDNYAAVPDLETSWGFACLVQTDDATLLFDTGGDGDILLRNMAALNIDPGAIDMLMISHDHWDHTGGLEDVVPRMKAADIFLLDSFSEDVKRIASGSSGDVHILTGPDEITTGMMSTGEIGGDIPEQALIVRTAYGAIIITGCAHPGIVDIVEKAIECTDDDILLIIGGFHLLRTGEEKLADIIAQLKELHVRNVAPSHCSGDAARRLFAKAYGDRFIEVGAGKTITLDDLLYTGDE